MTIILFGLDFLETDPVSHQVSEKMARFTKLVLFQEICLASFVSMLHMQSLFREFFFQGINKYSFVLSLVKPGNVG